MTDPASLRRWLDPHGQITRRVQREEPPHVLELDWDADGDVSVVRFELAVEGDRTVLVVNHELIDERVGMAHMREWTAALNRLDRELAQ